MNPWVITIIGLFQEYAMAVTAMVSLYLLVRVRTLQREVRSLNSSSPDRSGVITVNHSGMVKPTPDHIATIRNKSTDAVQPLIVPPQLYEFLVSVEYGQISQWAISEKVREDQDILRAITVAAVVYSYCIPCSLFLLDSRTVQIYDAYVIESQRTFINPDDIQQYSFSPCDDFDLKAIEAKAIFLAGKMREQSVTGELVKALYKQVPPPLTSLMTKLKYQDEDSIKAIATVYCAIAGIPVPKAYLAFTQLTYRLYRRVQYGERKLKVV